jgi:hypothetical protein
MANDNKPINYSLSIGVPVTATDAFDKLTSLQNWWPEEFVGPPLQLHSEFIFRIGASHYSKNKVIEFAPDKSVAWLTTESHRNSDDFDWSGTKFIFDLTPKSPNAVIKFTYDGVVKANEADRLVQICDMTVKEMLYNYLTSYSTSIEVETSAAELFRCIKDVSKWWGGSDFEGNSESLNDEFTINHPGSHLTTQKLVEVVPDKRMVWLVTEGRLHWLKDQYEWTGSKMIFEIKQLTHTTALTFTHSGLTPEKESFERCSQGWTTVIKDYLFNFVSHGKAHFDCPPR